MKVYSFERATGMGACHQTELRGQDDEGEYWYPLSSDRLAERVDQREGFTVFCVEDNLSVDEVRAFHRTNSGAVEIVPGHETRGWGRDVPAGSGMVWGSGLD